MELNEKQAEIATTLYRHWSAEKNLNCLRRQLSRIAEDLEEIAAGIKSELEGGDKRRVVQREGENGFTTEPANRVRSMSAPASIYTLPTADELGDLTEQFRAVCVELDRRQKEREDL